ncbi:multiple epidermal growth factor-like domains protein 10 [Saccostrea echinata]|uniref:multiple epidermal growth factor-like domains protein 10 n=1 Tax=Saccostrea echinata TaxID=191078 RepID=UPI002A7EC3A7|nr:multiple epidermal growth factor-like domains protein 10 [Saccostrea echinata]
MGTVNFAINLFYLEIIYTSVTAQSCRYCGGDGSCNERSQCNYGCVPGFFSLTCTQTCGQCAGNGSCNIVSGFCDENKCKATFFGPPCTQPCPIFCGGDGSCDFTTANCNEGCKLGYMGARCEISCPYINCKNPCNVLNGGSCTSGCLDGFYGEVCDKRCECPDTRVCEQKTGICIVPIFLTTPCGTDSAYSCIDSTSSTQFLKSSTTRNGGDIEKMNVGLVAGLTMSLVLVLILSSLSVFLLYKYNKRKQKKPHVYEGPVIQQAKEIVYDSLEAIAENDYVEIRSDSYIREMDDGYTTVNL